jgi:hypothetical protein
MQLTPVFFQLFQQVASTREEIQTNKWNILGKQRMMVIANSDKNDEKSQDWHSSHMPVRPQMPIPSAGQSGKRRGFFWWFFWIISIVILIILLIIFTL